mgnify:CR=1 FL=1
MRNISKIINLRFCQLFLKFYLIFLFQSSQVKILYQT